MEEFALKRFIYLLAAIILMLSSLYLSGCDSNDSNKTAWTETRSELSGCHADSIVFDSQSNVLYVGVPIAGDSQDNNFMGVWKYNGNDWTHLSKSLNGEGLFTGKGVRSLTYDPVNDLVYAGFSGMDEDSTEDWSADYGVWKYDGKTWTDTGGALSNQLATSLLYDSDDDVLFAGTTSKAEDGVWKYDGKSWTETGLHIPDGSFVSSLEYDPEDGVLFAGVNLDGVWKYDGKTWNDISGEISGFGAISLAYDQSSKILYVGTKEAGIWRFDGSAWSSTGGALSDNHICSLAYDSEHNLLYAGNYFDRKQVETEPLGMWVYDGSNWVNTGGEISKQVVHSIAYDTQRKILYAGISDFGVWKYDPSKTNL